MSVSTYFDSEGVSIFGDKVLTVGQLRDMLANVPDDVHVVIGSDDWYQNVNAVALPDGGVNFCCVTLFQGATYDARQQ
jgi:hypothetical protein